MYLKIEQIPIIHKIDDDIPSKHEAVILFIELEKIESNRNTIDIIKEYIEIFLYVLFFI